MKKLFYVSLLLFISIVICDGDFLILNKENFDTLSEKHHLIFINFSSKTDCPVCDQFEKEYKEAYDQMKKINENVIFATVDANEEREIAEHFSIESLPTLVFLTEDKAFPYNGGTYTSKDMIDWLVKRTSPPSEEFSNPVDLNQKVKNLDSSVVYIGSLDSNDYETFKNATYHFYDVNFYHCSSEECSKDFELKGNTVLIIQNNGDKLNKMIFDKEMKEEVLAEWIDHNTLPVIKPVSERVMRLVYSKNNTVLMFFRKEEMKSQIDQIIRDVADKMGDKYIYVVSGDNSLIEEQLSKYVGVNSNEFPTVVIKIIDQNGIAKYKLSGEMNLDNIYHFLGEFETGVVPMYFKSEAPVPNDPNSNYLEVVGLNFDELVWSAPHSTFMLFYAHDDSISQVILKLFDKFSKDYKNEENIKFAKMNILDNEVEELHVDAYPTVIFYPSNNIEDFFIYEGDYSESDLKAFLDNNIKKLNQKDEEIKKDENSEAFQQTEENKKEDL